MPSTTTTAGAEDEPAQFTDLEDKKHRYLLSKKEQRAHHRSVDDSVKRFKYLLGLTDLFRHFIDLRAKDDPKFRSILKEVDRSNTSSSSSKRGRGNRSNNRRRKTEREEDAELLYDEEEEPHTTVFTESPSYVHGKLREYQVQGLNWLISLHENGISGILADEMGLGKTLQTISFLGYLRYVQGIEGPHIVIVPKSTLDNWGREFAKWTPNVRTFILQGDKESRAQLVQDRLLSCDFDICIASYEMVIKEKAQLRKFAWQYIIVDEAHRIKNEDSMLSQIIRLFHSNNRLLITGTPLQNNMHELWALLNFILPDVFSDSQVFDQWFENSSDQDTVVQQLHKVLRPFLLRRVKSDVEKSLLPKKEINIYTGMTEMQVKWYRRLLEKDIDAVNGAVGKREGKTRLLNIVMQLRKCCNHPYLFEGAEPGPPYTTDEHLVDNAGKMIILDKLLKHVRKQGSRVLIFSQMSRMLDILEDYCTFREWEYSRIDGSTNHEDRIAAIDEYNKPGSDKFVFLLTTRAGGLGINLTTADVVILYDSDWNPQADLQAMDRAHRIGQTKQVMVFRFVTERAIEEKVLERAAQKLRLDQLVIQQGRASQNAAKNATTSKDELLQMIQHGAQEVFESKSGGTMSETNIEDILHKGEERTAQLNAKYATLGIDDLQKFTSDSSAYEWNGENFKKSAGSNGMGWINPSKRERKEQTYSIDGYYKGIMSVNKPNSGPRTHRAPRQVHMLDFQFYDARLRTLQEKEMNYYRKTVNQKVSINDIDDSDLDDDETKEQRRRKENKIIADAEPLTEEEEAEKQELARSGFSDWSKRDFTSFIHHVAKYGRDNYTAIARQYHDKTPEDIRQYSEVFWQRYKEIDGYDRYLAQIEAGEEKNKKLIRQQKQLRQKIESYRAPMSEMTITYPVSNAKKTYTEEEDRFLLLQVDELGLDSPNLYEKIQERIKHSPLFRFDWFFLSRTPVELSRRVSTLLLAITREFDGPTALKRKSGPRKAVHNDGDSSVADTPVSNAMSPDISYDDEYDENNSAGTTPAPASKKQKKIRTDVVKEIELGKA
ncbi:ISWI chromatin-remodeling complex ATPase Isw2p [Trichomonascus vanleenenianus]|uniref:ISWI chromatin-remodeling complex ATPase Isw2p n=1 Tax=Trichomonascus vanleenenianus TaxID=2268995 RepID=UPI003EC9F015